MAIELWSNRIPPEHEYVLAWRKINQEIVDGGYHGFVKIRRKATLSYEQVSHEAVWPHQCYCNAKVLWPELGVSATLVGFYNKITMRFSDFEDVDSTLRQWGQMPVGADWSMEISFHWGTREPGGYDHENGQWEDHTEVLDDFGHPFLMLESSYQSHQVHTIPQAEFLYVGMREVKFALHERRDFESITEAEMQRLVDATPQDYGLIAREADARNGKESCSRTIENNSTERSSETPSEASSDGDC